VTTAEAEQLVTEGKARWFRSSEDAEDFAGRTGGCYVGEVERSPVYVGRASYPATACHLVVRAVVSYIEALDGPVTVGNYWGSDVCCFGLYRVQIGDFVHLSSHVGFPGTVSADPLDIEDESIRRHLIALAVASRTAASE